MNFNWLFVKRPISWGVYGRKPSSNPRQPLNSEIILKGGTSVSKKILSWSFLTHPTDPAFGSPSKETKWGEDGWGRLGFCVLVTRCLPWTQQFLLRLPILSSDQLFGRLHHNPTTKTPDLRSPATTDDNIGGESTETAKHCWSIQCWANVLQQLQSRHPRTNKKWGFALVVAPNTPQSKQFPGLLWWI